MEDAESQDLPGFPPVVDHNAREREDDLKWPNRPRNHGETLPFHTLHQDLFKPLTETSKKVNQQHGRSLRQIGPKAVNSQSPHEIRRAIIERYISRWRKEVGNDFYPALRLILPDKDRDRAMYGLKEKVLARYIIKILKIDKHSDDGYNLLNFKQPGKNIQGAGDFPARVHDVFKKRPFRTTPGNMTIAEVNNLLNDLSSSPKEEQQLPIIELFYRQMNPDELKWLFCIILRTMHVGSTERTFFKIWHPDAEVMFNISSSLKRVTWELWNTNIRLEREEDQGITVGECFQPQLAQYQPKKLKSTIAKMLTTEESVFWIEEKLDGERMQLHMETVTKDEKQIKTFKFWSRKAKDYTYLYGSTFTDETSALTRHLKEAFDEGVESIVLDGEMITWDMETDKMVPFGTLKTAALEQQRNPFSTAPRPLYRVFDVLHLNGKDLTKYDLRTRRKDVLERVVNPVDRRLELLKYTEGRTYDDVESALRRVVAEASEGLVVKNPLSRYRLNDRNDDWLKVKPEYMQEYGESLDCVVIGGYYGSGRRGGGLSSFLCALRVDEVDRPKSTSCQFLSFFKVGGGFNADDYANVRHQTDGKWVKWTPQNRPQNYTIPSEIPDVWIRPEDSVVLQVKAASVTPSDEFGVNLTLRFPRFQKLRSDKNWESALSLQELYDVREAAENKKEENKQQAEMQAESRKRHQRVDVRSRPLQVVGYNQKSINAAAAKINGLGPSTNVFKGLTIYVMTDCAQPEKKSKIELEEMIKLHGGRIIQTASKRDGVDGKVADEVICIGNRRSVKVASLMKAGNLPILKPIWLFDCIAQTRKDLALDLSPLPLRPENERHVFFAPEDRLEMYEMEIDQYGDSYARDVSVEELRDCMAAIQTTSDGHESDERILDLIGEAPGWIFKGTVIHFIGTYGPEMSHDGQAERSSQSRAFEVAQNTASFAGARLTQQLEDPSVTHVVIEDSVIKDREQMKAIRFIIAEKKRIPRVVTIGWIEESWKERTRLDEERFAPI